MRSSLDEMGEMKRGAICDMVAKTAARLPLVTLAASNDDLSLAALVSMLARLSEATRGNMRVLVDRPVTPYLTVSANDGAVNLLTPQSIAVGWAAANDIDVVACADTVAPAAVLIDPWASNVGPSICRWHLVARKALSAMQEAPGATHVGVFDRWTASGRGAAYSLDHVTDNQVPRMTIHMGCNVPVSGSLEVGKAPFHWMLPTK